MWLLCDVKLYLRKIFIENNDLLESIYFNGRSMWFSFPRTAGQWWSMQPFQIPSVYLNLLYWLTKTVYEAWQLSSRNARIYVASSSDWERTKQRRVTTCLWLCVGEANKAVVAKQWQCYTSVCFRSGEKKNEW
jgi:hypothetical protein